MQKKGPKIVFMGTPSFAAYTLKALVESGYDIVGVVTVPDKPSGRGLKMNISAVKEYALTLNVPILQPILLKEDSFLSELASLGGELFVVVAFRMLPKIVWSMPSLGTFNLHASLLPNYRGAAPINWAIINGESTTGVTTFFLDEKIDTGKTIFSRECPIGQNEDFLTIHDRLMELGATLVKETVDAIESGDYTTHPQPELSEYKPAPKLTRETGKISWEGNASAIHNLIRGLSPSPGAYSTLCKEEKEIEIKIYKTILIDNNTQNANPGQVACNGKKVLSVQCGRGALQILELQAAGKKRLKAHEFIAGWHDSWDDVHFK